MHSLTSNKSIRALLAVAILLGASAMAFAAPEPGIPLFHVAYDAAPEVYYGEYLGLPNPNYERLTLVYSHTFVDTPWSNHFHWIGAYSYEGGIADPVVGFSTNNRVPEPYQFDDGLALLPGSGAFDGMLVSGLGPDARPGDIIEQEYGDVAIRPIDNLFQYDGLPHPDAMLEDPNPVVDGALHPLNYLVNANGGFYKNTMDGVRVGLELTDLSDGLDILDAAGDPIFSSVGDIVTLGEGTSWDFDPVFAVDSESSLGDLFSASFKLVDLSDSPVYGDSAEFSFDFVSAPEPSAAAIGLLGVMAIAARRRG